MTEFDAPSGLLLLAARGGDPRERRIAQRVRLMALRGLLAAAPAAAGRAASAQIKKLQGQWSELAARRGEALLQAIGVPELEGPLLCLDRGVGAPEGLWASIVPTLLLQLSRRGLAEEGMLWEAPACTPVLIDEGVALEAEAGIVGLSVDPSGPSVRLGDGAICGLADPRIRRRQVHWGIAGGARLSIYDANPIANAEEHPEKSGNAISLGGREAEVWLGELRSAAGLLDTGLPGWREDAGARAERLMPVGWEPERHLSASYRELPGQLYLTLHPNTLTLAEAWVHEAQHGRLNRLLLLDPALKNGRSTWTPSPVRPDLRPLIGVLLAVHAFVPVAAMHRRLSALGHPLISSPEGQARRALVLRSNAHGLQILAELGDWTAVGAQLFADLRALHAWSAVDTGAEIGDINGLPA